MRAFLPTHLVFVKGKALYCPPRKKGEKPSPSGEDISSIDNQTGFKDSSGRGAKDPSI
jgi:hypothetical protein